MEFLSETLRNGFVSNTPAKSILAKTHLNFVALISDHGESNMIFEIRSKRNLGKLTDFALDCLVGASLRG